jgi:hypothetical protein
LSWSRSERLPRVCGWRLSGLELVKKPELEVTLRNEIERQRGIIELEKAREKEERVREEVLRWANPILGAVEDLYERLGNILFGRGISALHPDNTESGQWSVSYDYFMYSTLYYFGVYFAYALALRNTLALSSFRIRRRRASSSGRSMRWFTHWVAIHRHIAPRA